MSTSIKVIQDLEVTNNDVLLERGYYKISWEDNYVIVKFKKDTWENDIKKFIYDKYSGGKLSN